MTILLENIETKEVVEYAPGTTFRHPWKVKMLAPAERAAKQTERVKSYWENYSYKKCSKCGEKGVYEST